MEDARDAAPSWNPQGDRIAYSSTNFGDDRFRIYLTWADGTRETVELGLGKDPAWHPSEDLIVYNGTDETGNNPGLWLMRTDGTERERLTDNGNDQRPAWLPDGSGVVFMSNGRDGNWELYRLDIATRAVTRLTDNIAQDGLPAVSPDGRYVAFMTDRDGYWSLWYVPVDGGSPARPCGHRLTRCHDGWSILPSGSSRAASLATQREAIAACCATIVAEIGAWLSALVAFGRKPAALCILSLQTQ